MKAIANEIEGRLKIVIQTSDNVERWFLRAFMEHGASVELVSSEHWTNIVLTSRSPEEAELAGIYETLGGAP